FVYSLLYGSAPPASYTLSLHDALPISSQHFRRDIHPFQKAHIGPEPLPHQTSTAAQVQRAGKRAVPQPRNSLAKQDRRTVSKTRSEEHTSELQSRENLVCRLLLEKKK